MTHRTSMNADADMTDAEWAQMVTTGKSQSAWAMKTPEEIIADFHAAVARYEIPKPRLISNIIPKSVWLQLPVGQRKYYRYPKPFDFPIGPKRQRREVRQDWKYCKCDGCFEYHPITGERFY